MTSQTNEITTKPDPNTGSSAGWLRMTLSRFYALFYWALFLLANILMFPGALLLFVLIAPFDANRRVQHIYSCFWAQIFFYVNPFWSLRVDGRHNLPRRHAAVLVVNHESLGDILALFGLYSPFKWISKASVFKVPFIGWNMYFSRYIPVVRGNRNSIEKMMATCRAWLDRRVPVLFFPEGTRSPDGEVQKFKDGAFRLAIEAGVPVVPMALVGMADCLPKHSHVAGLWVRARLSILDPVDTASFEGDVAALRDHVRDLIIAEKARVQAAS